ncbi:MAG: NAD(+) diphosphatase [Hyphomicrobiaceae bacterium]
MPTLAATALLDRMSPKRPDKDWVDAQLASPTVKILPFCDLKPVITPGPDRTSAKLRWLSRHEATQLGLPEDRALFLGVSRDDGTPHFAIAISEHEAQRLEGAAQYLRPSVDLRSLAMQGVLSSAEQSLAGKARALAQWHENSSYCGKCGAPSQMMDGGWRRKCTGCGMDHFPRTDPVVIMLVTDGERCIMAHEYRYANNMWSTLAGFLEPGEDIEHAVRREVLEETNIKVGRVDYLQSQPWPFPHSLMMGCIAHAETTDITVDKTELAEARWFTRDEARMMLEGSHPEGLTAPGRHAIAHILVKAFVEGRTA